MLEYAADALAYLASGDWNRERKKQHAAREALARADALALEQTLGSLPPGSVVRVRNAAEVFTTPYPASVCEPVVGRCSFCGQREHADEGCSSCPGCGAPR